MRDGSGERRRGGTRTGFGPLAIWGVIAALSLAAVPARAADPWTADESWVSVRVGSAGSGARFAPRGDMGYGFGFTYFLGNQVAWSATVQHDVLGRFGEASEIEVPFTAEFTKHFKLSSTARPYMGAGFGAIYHKLSRTGDDASGFRQGIYFTMGGNAMMNASNLLGVDFRTTLEQNTRTLNNTFPNPKASTRNWSLKVSYSRVL